jgi:hypothetical protein
MQSIIVRVYRKNPDNKNDVAGTVEKIGTHHKCTFMDLPELHESLEHFIKSDDLDEVTYSEAKQLDMYGYDLMSLNC